MHVQVQLISGAPLTETADRTERWFTDLTISYPSTIGMFASAWAIQILDLMLPISNKHEQISVVEEEHHRQAVCTIDKAKEKQGLVSASKDMLLRHAYRTTTMDPSWHAQGSSRATESCNASQTSPQHTHRQRQCSRAHAMMKSCCPCQKWL